MFTIILLVQVLIYPQFLYVGRSDIQRYSQSHQRRISYIVVPLMLLEALTLAYLWTLPAMHGIDLSAASILLISIWSLTFFAIVPVHKRISTDGSIKDIHRLISLNGYRTLFWGLKTVFILMLLLQSYYYINGHDRASYRIPYHYCFNIDIKG